MKYKRLIFTLLYANGNFHISRNFRLQKVGNLQWLMDKYKLQNIAFSIDELIILNVERNRNEETWDEFLKIIKIISSQAFIPIAAGGGIQCENQIVDLIKSGADKVVLNSILYDVNLNLQGLTKKFGKSTLVASLDFQRQSDNYLMISSNGLTPMKHHSTHEMLGKVQEYLGELLINSIDRDGTGFGLDLELTKILPKSLRIPVILAGGVGNGKHILDGLNQPQINAIATAQLFNFIGDGLLTTRRQLISSGANLVNWDEK
jgi:cyclase